MAARAGGPPGGAQVITTFNGGNVVSTQVPSLNFDGENAGDLIKTITGVQPNMVNGVTLDNTFIGHQQYRYLPYPVNSRTITFQFTTPNWCHVRDMALNLQLIFRTGSNSSRTQVGQGPIDMTKKKIYHGMYHTTNGGILSMFQNMRIKLGAQVDIFTAFEKTKSAYHILNTWLRGKWDQMTVFALIDRWDAWYPSGITKGWNPNIDVVTGTNKYTAAGLAGQFDFLQEIPPYMQSDAVFERKLSRTLAEKGLLRTNVELDPANPVYGLGTILIQAVENVSIPFTALHSLFQQNIMLPPGLQFIIEAEVPMYTNFDIGAQAELEPANALWANIGFILPPYSDNVWGTNLNDIDFQTQTQWAGCNPILVAVNQSSIFNSITMNCVNMKPEVARSLQDERIKRPLVYNYSQMIATTVGSYFPGQSVYNFTLPPNQAIPTQFIFGWVNPTMFLSETNAGTMPGNPDTTTWTTPAQGAPAYGNGLFNLNNAAITTSTQGMYYPDGPGPFDNNVNRNFLGSSFTPLPVNYKRMIVRRGGFQEIFQYGTYYDGIGANQMGIMRNTGTVASNNVCYQNTCTMLGVKNLTPDSTQKYFDHLEEYQWDRKSTNGLGPIERRLKYSYTSEWLTEGKWCAFQVNPCKNDLGQYSSDQNAYSVDIQLEMDWDMPLSVRWSGLNSNSKLVCIRVMPAQLSYAIDGTVRIYVWPNLLISPNAVVSGNPPPAGPGGSV